LARLTGGGPDTLESKALRGDASVSKTEERGSSPRRFAKIIKGQPLSNDLIRLRFNFERKSTCLEQGECTIDISKKELEKDPAAASQLLLKQIFSEFVTRERERMNEEWVFSPHIDNEETPDEPNKVA
jgi:hypothetical protein